jgi:hypothetical protein
VDKKLAASGGELPEAAAGSEHAAKVSWEPIQRSDAGDRITEQAQSFAPDIWHRKPDIPPQSERQHDIQRLLTPWHLLRVGEHPAATIGDARPGDLRQIRLAELKAVEAGINVATGRKKEAEAARFKGLVTMYENMKPRDAAKIFDRLSKSACSLNWRRKSTRGALPTSWR